MSDRHETVGRLVAVARKALGLTFWSLDEEAKVGHVTIGRIEAMGRGGPYTVGDLRKVLAALERLQAKMPSAKDTDDRQAALVELSRPEPRVKDHR